MKINFKSPALIIFLVGLVVIIIGISCASFGAAFMVVASCGWIICSFSVLYWTIMVYVNRKRAIDDARYCDAYLYAEDKDNPEEAMQKFGYDKKTERKIKWYGYNNFMVPLIGALCLIIGVVMLITAINAL
ncbi:MAG: hypothetical protein IJZ26_00820 [Clostridia bacterium]|nr:hypothetical protein [Clostridia bacterium]